MRRKGEKKGLSKIMFIVVSLLLISFLGAIVVGFIGDFLQASMSGGKPLSVVSDLLGGI